MNYLVEMKNISKGFPGVKALEDVNLRIREKEILGLLGENGAGKSTLIKILTGVYKPDAGDILISGEPVFLHDTKEAHARGISTIFQELSLIPNLSILENLFLGNEIRNKLGFIDFKAEREVARALFAKLGISLDLDALVASLGVAQQQMTEIIKALLFKVKVLIMDEPTSSLTEKEIAILFTVMGELRSSGVSIIFISHKLEEVLRITDRIAVLRDGHNVGEAESAGCTADGLVSMMVGRDIDRLFEARKKKYGDEIVLELRDYSGPPSVKNVSFALRRGEILGLSGLVGAGRTELAKLIIGYDKKTGGAMMLNGAPVEIRSPVDAVKHRIAYLSEDRKNLALILPMSVRENVTLSVLSALTTLKCFINTRKEGCVSDRYIEDLKVKVSSREQAVKNLSGGNQQKVVISKWLATKPLVLILDEPTRGIDVAAKAEVHRIITELADEGMSILLISSELPEILALSDRIVVMHEGRVSAVYDGKEADPELIMKSAVALSPV